jgi:hypothetical protein
MTDIRIRKARKGPADWDPSTARHAEKSRQEWPREAVPEKQRTANPHRIFAERAANESRSKSSKAAERATGMVREIACRQEGNRQSE